MREIDLINASLIDCPYNNYDGRGDKTTYGQSQQGEAFLVPLQQKVRHHHLPKEPHQHQALSAEGELRCQSD